MERAVRLRHLRREVPFPSLALAGKLRPVKNDLTLVVLTGGDSTRMGSRKVELRIGGRLFAEHIHERLAHLFDETLIVGSAPPAGMSQAWRHVPDLLSIRTPLAGIYSGLAAAETPRCFVVACDMPWVSPSLVELLAGHALEERHGADGQRIPGTTVRDLPQAGHENTRRGPCRRNPEGDGRDQETLVLHSAGRPPSNGRSRPSFLHERELARRSGPTGRASSPAS
jgi:hypothetical protein